MMMQLKLKKINIKKIIKNIGKGLAFLIFLYGLFTALVGLHGYFKDVFFKNDIFYQKLSQINTLVSNSYVDNLFGEPFLIRKLPADFWNLENNQTGVENLTERIYNNEKFYLQTISGENNEIIAYSITSKDKNFNPSIPLELWHGVKRQDGSYDTEKFVSDLKLGKSYFRDLKDDIPERISFNSPNQHTFYLEGHYFGRPGNYKYYLFGISPYGSNESNDKMYDLAFAFEEGNDISNNPDFLKWRLEQKFNTFGVVDLTVLSFDVSTSTENIDTEINSKLLDYLFYFGLGPTAEIIYNLNCMQNGVRSDLSWLFNSLLNRFEIHPSMRAGLCSVRKVN
jgi:hypothetical protein